jgi:exodeoxyribonuclease X
MTARLLDTETTSVDDPQIIEMAWMNIHPPHQSFGWEDDEPEVYRFKPTKPIQFGAMNVHHILPDDLADCAPSSQATLPVGTTYLLGHNIDFDWKALGSPTVKRICTLALCRSLWPDTDSHSLGAMLYFLDGATDATREKLARAHAAEFDIANNWIILQHIIAKLGVQTLDELWRASEKARIPVKMTFGKHKGKLVTEVDKGYANWYSKQEDTDEYLMQAFRLAGLLPPKRV